MAIHHHTWLFDEATSSRNSLLIFIIFIDWSIGHTSPYVIVWWNHFKQKQLIDFYNIYRLIDWSYVTIRDCLMKPLQAETAHWFLQYLSIDWLSIHHHAWLFGEATSSRNGFSIFIISIEWLVIHTSPCVIVWWSHFKQKRLIDSYNIYRSIGYPYITMRDCLMKPLRAKIAYWSLQYLSIDWLSIHHHTRLFDEATSSRNGLLILIIFIDRLVIHTSPCVIVWWSHFKQK